MKKIVVILAIIFSFQSFKIEGQNNLQNNIPNDSSVKIGKLKNGLTYYIKQNAKPKNKAELRLVLKAGSILEDQDQLGLAHFIEHMAFNGTKHFPKNELINYLQNIGVEFGADLNAHTSFDETVYKLSVPTDNETIKTSLQVLRDWADGITFDHEEIDKERGVVAEELRARNGVGSRMYYQSIPVLTNNSRYAERAPIGTLDVILNAKYSALKRFYKDWYRPDLMALVFVGDFNLEDIEQQIKTTFSSIKSAKKPRERVYYNIPNNDKPAVTVQSDKEATGSKVSIYVKRFEDEVNTLNDLKQVVLQRLYSGMLRQRLSEIEVEPNAPFLSAKAGIGNFLSTTDSYFLGASLKENQLLNGVEGLLIESERAKRYGFTEAELERYKKSFLNNANIRRKEEGKLSNKYYVEQYIDNFTSKTPIPSDNFSYNFYKDILPSITVADVNAISKKWVRDDNMAIVLNTVEKEDVNIPTNEEVIALIDKVKNLELEPYIDKLSNVKLLETPPNPGHIVATEYNKEVDVTTWKLANGITVIVKPTRFQNDLISMSGFRSGGSSTAPDSIYVSARNAGNIIGKSGVNGISNINLEKLSMGKTVSVSPRINYYDDLFSGSSSSADLEYMMKLVHLYFTKPNRDENAFVAFKEGLKSVYKNQDDSPSAYFEKEIAKNMTHSHLRSMPLTVKQIENELDLDQAFNFYKERFANANGFTFVFVGSLKLENLKPLVEQYLGSLPSNLNEESKSKDTGLRYATGVGKKVFYKGISDKSTVDLRFTGAIDFSLEEKEHLSLLAKLLKIKLTEELREKMSGVYGVRVSSFASKIPYQWYRIAVRFTCDPENVDKLIAKTQEEINNIKNHGASQINITKIKQAELANYEQFLENNNFWSSKLKTSHEYDLDLESILEQNEVIEEINSEMFKTTAKKYFNDANYAEFILMPEKAE
ncbi:insulinase family protein [Tamlana sp. 62-3]|uniref:Insulinase family protein n=1 Tax=Neotamlana sargassicola TaxID=2883125 RepID=A0A9X1I8B5_9FLAO|nr:M16 family metallopeptidase [Tamlana sargassicola]MCB4808209.1 insulinase family protein [Tamlana sargassicola]